MDYKERLKEILRENGKSGKWLAQELGLDYTHFRKMTQKKGWKASSWVRSFVIAYNLKRDNDE